MILSGCGNDGDISSSPPVPAVTLAVVDSIPGTTDGSECIIGAIERISLLPDGSVLVLDIARTCIFRFGPDNSFEGLIGESGPGPGEMSYPSDMTVMSDGTIAVSDAMKGAVLLYSPEGVFEGMMEGFPMTPVRDMHPCPGEGFVGWRSSLETADGRYSTSIRVCRWTESGDPETVYLEKTEPSDLSSFSAMLKQSLYSVRVTVDTAGRVFVAPLSTEEYSILCYGADGELYNTISLDLPMARRTAAEMETETVQMENRMRRMGDHGMPMVWEPDPFRIMAGEMGVDGEGNLWVRRGTEPVPLFDVFDPNTGRRLLSAEVDYSGDCSGWIFSIEPEGFLAWSADAESCQTVYRLSPSGTE
jgi:hypothetical protein